MREVVFVDEKNALDRVAHAILLKVFPHAVKPRLHRPVFLVHGVLGAEGVVRERIEVHYVHF